MAFSSLSDRGPNGKTRSALIQSALWFALALAFAAVLFFWQGRQLAVEFFTGYVVELSLSVDNLFIFLLIFRYFTVPEQQQHRVLFWGIVGALLMRAVFIVLGVGLIARYHWIFYGMGALLIYSGIRLAFTGDQRVDPAKNPAVRLVRRLLPVTTDFEDGHFFVRGWQGKPGLHATPLLIVLAVIETTDLLFAVDSIPAVLAITLNPLIVFCSNFFAILGLRSLFFAVSGLMKQFRFLHQGLAVILVLIGTKMIAEYFFKVPTLGMLGTVAGVLALAMMLSMVFPVRVPAKSIDGPQT